VDFRGKEKLSYQEMEWLRDVLALWFLKTKVAKGKPGEWILAHIQMPESKMAVYNCGMWEPVQVSPPEIYPGRRRAYWAKFQIPKRSFVTRIP